MLEEASIYLRELTKPWSRSEGTVSDVAYILCAWCNYLLGQRRSWAKPNTSDLAEWVAQLYRSGSVGGTRRTRCFNVVFTWYHFLLSRRLGGDDLRAFVAGNSQSPLELEQPSRKPRFKVGYGDSKPFKKRPTPDSEQVSKVLDTLASEEKSTFLAERDWLIGKTAAETGLRAMGTAKLDCRIITAMLAEAGLAGNQPPVDVFWKDASQKSKIRQGLGQLKSDGGELLFASIIEKGRKRRTVAFPIELVEQILDHIWGERAATIQRYPSLRGSFGRGLWISGRGGQPLKLTSIKGIIKAAFLSAEVRGSAHSLRSFFLTKMAKQLLIEARRRQGQNFDSRAVLLLLAEIAGHEDPETLRYYLDRAQIADALLDDEEQRQTER